MTTWDVEAIAAVLSAPVRQRQRAGYGLELTLEKTATRLKLDLDPARAALRLWGEQTEQGQWTVIGRVDLAAITAIRIDPEERQVTFVTGQDPATELVVTADVTFRLTVGERALAINAPEQGEDELVQLVGRLARPHYSERGGRPFFTAGLAEYPDGAIAPTWHNLKAFGGVARAARHLERGAWVRLTGKRQVERYQKDGQAVNRPVILLVHIEAAG